MLLFWWVCDDNLKIDCEHTVFWRCVLKSNTRKKDFPSSPTGVEPMNFQRTEHISIYFHFIQVTISLIIYPHLSFWHIWALQDGRTRVTHMNPVYDLAHHESPIAQWLERPTGILDGHGFDSLWGTRKIFFSEYSTWEHISIYFHFIQVTISLIIYTVFCFYFILVRCMLFLPYRKSTELS